MKYYKLKKDLPTFKKGEQFFVNDYGQLISCAHEGVVAYSAHTLKRFPDVLKDWFEEVPAPERDSKTKYAFMEYISDHREERFFQAVLNFTRLYLDEKVDRVCCHRSHRKAEWCEDTFYWECDDMLKEEE